MLGLHASFWRNRRLELSLFGRSAGHEACYTSCVRTITAPCEQIWKIFIMLDQSDSALGKRTSVLCTVYHDLIVG